MKEKNGRARAYTRHARLQQFAQSRAFYRRPWVWVVAALCALALVTGMLVPALFSMGEAHLSAAQAQRITVQPTESGPLGMGQESAFSIRAPGLNKRLIENSVSLSPSVEYRLERGEDGAYLLVPEVAFEPGKIVNLTFTDYKGRTLRSWAFQTETPFAVTNTLPADEETYVPLSSGIEFRFSSPHVSAEEFERCLTIEPAVQGHVEKFGSTLAFVPEENLQKNTRYTVTLDGSLSAGEGITLGASSQLVFRTSYYAENNYYRPPTVQNAQRLSESYLPGDPVMVEVRVSGEENDYFDTTPFAVTVYAYPSAEAYGQALSQVAAIYNQPLGYTETVQLPTEGLAVRSTFDATLGQRSAYRGTQYLAVPDELPEGYYLLEMRIPNPVEEGEIVLQKLVQVSSLSVFHAQVRDDITFWVNDTESGEPVSGAAVQVQGDAFALSGSTDQNGVLSTSTQVGEEEERLYSVMEISSGGRSYLDLIERASTQALTAEEQYYSYLFTDRPVYLGSDTIRFWGVVQPRASAQPLEQAEVVLGDGLYTTQVAVAPDGSFSGEIAFEKLGTGNRGAMSLALQLGDKPEERLQSRYVSIYDYRKPIYSTSTHTDKIIYENPLEEPIDFHFNATFFDGTPAAQLPIRMEYRSYQEQEEDTNLVELVTDDNGDASWEFVLQTDSTSWRPASVQVTTESNQAEGEYYSHYDQVMVAFRDVMLTGKPSVEGDEATLTVQANRLDFSGITSEEQLYDIENLRGESHEGLVSAELHHVYYEKEVADQYYDYIQKRYVTTYDYHRREEVLDTYTARTSGGQAVFTGLPAPNGEDSYYVVLTIDDQQGRPTTETVWLGEEYNPYGYYNDQYLFTTDKGEEENAYTFADGEALPIVVEHSERVSGEGRVLWAIAQDGLRDVHITDQLAFELPYDERNIPNMTLTGAFFDGRHVMLISSLSLRYDPQERALQVEIATDAESYEHGKPATVTLKVTDQQGNPAAGASVSAAVVDESVFAILEQNADPLRDFYAQVWYPNILSYVSYHDYSDPNTGGGEMGGGGSDGTRTDFSDMAYFFTGMTDEKGEATFSFELPDSLTSWRITAQTVKEGKYLGVGVKNVVTTGTFFLQPVAPEAVLTGDDTVVALRAYGEGIASDAEVAYTVTLKGDGYEQSVEATGQANSYVNVQLETPPKGSYTLVMEGRSGELYDGIERTLTVSESGTEVYTVRTFDPAQGLELNPERFPVELALYNSAYQFYGEVLADLTQNAHGPRVDALLAQQYISDRMAGEGTTDATQDPFLSELLSSDGSVQLLRYSEPDVLLAARVHAAAPQYLPNTETTQVFLSVLTDTNADPEELCAAYLGLAAHKEPVLLDILALLENPEGLSQRGQLNLVAALALLGAYDEAIAYYDAQITPTLVTTQDPAGREMAHVELGEGSEEVLANTASASIAASVLGNKDAQPLLRYLMQTESVTDPYLLEELIFLRYFVPETEEAATVRYTLDGEDHTLELAPCEVQYLHLSSRQFENLNLQVTSGQIGAQANYITTAAEAMDAPNQNITLHKTIEPVDGGKIAVDSTLKVTLRLELPDGFVGQGLVINDYIPTGTRYLGSDLYGSWNDGGQEGQKVSFYSSYNFGREEVIDPYAAQNPDTERNPSTSEEVIDETMEETVVYYVRCVTPGMYVNESAYILCPENGVWGMTDRGVVLIDK